AESTWGAAFFIFSLFEAVEHVRQQVGVNPLTRVRDLDPHLRGFLGHVYTYVAVPRGEFDRVVQQIPQDLLQAWTVAYEVDVGANHDVDVDAARISVGVKRVDRRIHERRDVQFVEIQLQFSRHHTGKVQERLDHAGLRLRVSLDGVQGVIHALRRQHA